MSKVAVLLNAVKESRFEIVKKLAFSEGIDKNTLRDSDHNPIVYLAIKKIKEGQSSQEKKAAIDIATLLIEAGYAVNTTNRHGHNPLYKAVKRGQSKIVDLLIKRGATFQSDPRDMLKLPNNSAISITPLLQLVVRGQLKEVDAYLQANPALVYATKDVTDLSNRTFSDITALQYAVWALDCPMWTLIMRYLSNMEAAKQIEIFKKRQDLIREHGLHYSFDGLLTQYHFYANNISRWNYGTRCHHWQQGVGVEQAKMPAWLIYAFTEYGADVAWTNLNTDKHYARVISEDFKTFHQVIRSGYAFTRGKDSHVFAETGWLGVNADTPMDDVSRCLGLAHDACMVHGYQLSTHMAYSLLEHNLEKFLNPARYDLGYKLTV